MNKKLFIIAIFYLLLIPFAGAITGSIGNAKAIVTVDLSKSNILERTVLVKNVNNVSINVKLESADDLESITEILDKEFELGPGEEKKARFKVNIPRPGTYNGNIVVFFNPPEGKGAGVVLQANLIIKAVGSSSELPFNTNTNTGTNTDNDDPKNNNDNTNNKITGSTIFETSDLKNIPLSIIIFIILIAVVVISGFIVLMRRI